MRIVRHLFPLACVGVFLVVGAGVGLPAGAQTTAPNEWTWMGGAKATDCSPQTCNHNPVYGTFGVLSAGNDPGSGRGETWTDNQGNFWLYAGALWKFDPAATEWAWVDPSDLLDCTTNCNAGYGTLGVPSIQNLPPIAQGAVTWTDTSGNLWLFGGYGTDIVGNAGSLNALWKYVPSSGAWEWVSGSNLLTCASSTACGVPGVYGTLGAPAPGNTPGGRTWAMSWADGSGHLWLFGGTGNDDSTPLTTSNQNGSLNDFWEFDLATTEWTWMGGSDSVQPNGYQPGVFGTLGVPSVANIPSSRLGGATWVDNGGHLWLFGGVGFLVTNPNSIPAGDYVIGTPNDLWEFDPSTKQWAWMGGSNVAGGTLGTQSPLGVYGTLGVPAAGNIPSGRAPAAHWSDKAGNFWLFGGYGYDGAGNYGYLNDLWEFNPSTKLWAWMGGSSTIPCLYTESGYECAPQGVYGTLGTTAAGNGPGGRSGSESWTDSNGNLWLRGGGAYNWTSTVGPNNPTGEADGGAEALDDLWEYHPSNNSLPPAATPVFSLPSGLYQSSQTLTISNGMTNANIYYTVDGTTPTSGSILYNAPITVSSTETVQAIALATGYPTSGLASASYDFKTYSPSFSQPGGTYNYAITVSITDAISSAAIYYTTDGSTPTSSSTQYSMPLAISTSETVKAIAVFNGYSSDVVSATYTMDLAPTAATPTFSVAGGTYTTNQSVTISDATSGATIYYTTNGTTPTTGSPVYSGPIQVTATETIEAIAAATGYSTSAVASATYTINLPASFSVAASPGSLTVTAGLSGTTVVTVSPTGGFSGAVTFACSGLPAGAMCSFSPATVTPPGTTSTTLTVATSSTTAEVRRGALLPGAALAVVVCCFGLRKRRRLLMLVLLAAGLGGLGLIGGCGGGGSGGGSGGGGTQPVTSTVTVAGTSGTLSSTATFTLTVN